ncbi:unnamed protein product [Amoebophrya sp. A25]|nr:unnamed protein product [Amoebophrya sp. A25]|eukprot:GSA25T00011764001.1
MLFSLEIEQLRLVVPDIYALVLIVDGSDTSRLNESTQIAVSLQDGGLCGQRPPLYISSFAKDGRGQSRAGQRGDEDYVPSQEHQNDFRRGSSLQGSFMGSPIHAAVTEKEQEENATFIAALQSPTRSSLVARAAKGGDAQEDTFASRNAVRYEDVRSSERGYMQPTLQPVFRASKLYFRIEEGKGKAAVPGCGISLRLLLVPVGQVLEGRGSLGGVKGAGVAGVSRRFSASSGCSSDSMLHRGTASRAAGVEQSIGQDHGLGDGPKAMVDARPVSPDLDWRFAYWLDFVRHYKSTAHSFSWTFYPSSAQATAQRKSFGCATAVVETLSVKVEAVTDSSVRRYFEDGAAENFIRAQQAREFDLIVKEEPPDAVTGKRRRSFDAIERTPEQDDTTFDNSGTNENDEKENLGRHNFATSTSPSSFRPRGVASPSALAVLRRRVSFCLSPPLSPKSPRGRKGEDMLKGDRLAHIPDFAFAWKVSDLSRVRKTPRHQDFTLNLVERNATKRAEIADLVKVLHARQVSLTAMEEERTQLEKQRRVLLHENAKLETEMEDIVHPDLTDIDADLYFAGANNPHDLYLKLHCADARLQRTRDKLLHTFGMWKKLEKLVEQSMETPEKLAQTADAIVEMRERLRSDYAADYAEYERLATLVQEQDVLLNQLQDRIKKVESYGSVMLTGATARLAEYITDKSSSGEEEKAGASAQEIASSKPRVMMPVIDRIEHIQLQTENAELQTRITKLRTRLPPPDKETEVFSMLRMTKDDVKITQEQIREKLSLIKATARKHKLVLNEFRDSSGKKFGDLQGANNADPEMEVLRFKERQLEGQLEALNTENRMSEIEHQHELFRLRGLLADKSRALASITSGGQ